MAIARRIGPALFLAQCPPAANLGDMVFVSGDRSGDIYQIDRCDISQANKRPWGIILKKITIDSCWVQTYGEIRDLYSGLIPGKPIFLGHGIGARLTQTFPGSAITHKIYLQIAGYATAADRFDLLIHNPVVLIP